MRMGLDAALREAGRALRQDVNLLPQMLAGWNEEEVEKLWDRLVQHANWLKRKIHITGRRCRRGKDLLRTDDISKVTCKSCRKWIFKTSTTEELIEGGYLEKRADGVLGLA